MVERGNSVELEAVVYERMDGPGVVFHVRAAGGGRLLEGKITRSTLRVLHSAIKMALGDRDVA